MIPFGKKPTIISNDTLDDLPEQLGGHDRIVDYMLALTDIEYDKLLKIVKVYREANRKVTDIMGMDEFIEDDEAVIDKMLDKISDDCATPEFIETEIAKKDKH